MAKIKPKAIAQMREILVGIVLGRLKHMQSTWHCGTAACVAGWNTNLNHKELADKAYEKYCVRLAEKMRQSPEEVHWALDDSPDGLSDHQLAQNDWGINDAEAEFMFGGQASLAEQIGLIEFLADGHRATGEWDGSSIADYDVPEKLPEYVARYETYEARLKWAKQHDVLTKPRAGAEVVKDLLKAKPKKPATRQTQTVEAVVETVKVAR